MRRIQIAIVLLLLCGAVEAQVRVSVTIAAPLMKAKYRPKTLDAEKAIVDELVNKLPSYFSQWSYAPADTAAGPVPDFTLSVRIYEHLGAHKFDLSLDAPAQRIKTWKATWMESGEHIPRGFPDRALAGKQIADEIVQLLVSEHQDQIFTELKRVPLAKSGRWLRAVGRREEPRLVLPLRWPGSKVLVRSTLRIECTGNAKLYSEALDAPAFYDDTATLRYKALVVKPLMRVVANVRTDVRSIHKEVRSMTAIAVYLESTDPLGLQSAGTGQ